MYSRLHTLRALPWRLILVLALLTLSNSTFLASKSAQAAGVTTYTGTINGAGYKVEVPPNWNGTLVLYSHGYTVPGSPKVATDVGDPVTGGYLLTQGYALAGSSYSTQGWALKEAFTDQINVLDWFGKNVGKPKRTIAWGHSLGGIITAGLIQKYPERFDGALPMCGVLSGGVGAWNEGIDSSFAFKTLLAANTNLQVVHITNPQTNAALAVSILDKAQTTPEGRAKIALVGALGDIAEWFDPLSPEPASNDYASRELNQYTWARFVDFPFAFALRAELEARAGGNPSWNIGVNYRQQLERSGHRDTVEALYKAAGLDLDADLGTLNRAPRIKPDPKAVEYLVNNIVFNGQIEVPVLTMHTTNDGLVPVENERTYGRVVREEGNGRLLRQIYVNRAGHCSFTPAETITAFQTLIKRLDTERWDGYTDPDVLNQKATALGPTFNIFSQNNQVVSVPSAFTEFQPGPFVRPFVYNDIQELDFDVEDDEAA